MGNPFVCDCRFRWFPDYIASLGPLIFSGECSEPSVVAGAPLTNLTLDQFVCQCDPPCVEGTCNTTVGVCECDEGWMGVTCDAPCPNGTYGQNCQFACQCVNSDVPCHHVNGTCYCNSGYTGDRCNESECRSYTPLMRCLRVRVHVCRQCLHVCCAVYVLHPCRLQ